MSSRLLPALRSVPRTHLSRSLATVSDAPVSSTSETQYKWQTRPPRKPSAKERAMPGHVKLQAETPEGHLRPHLNIPINPNHGLYGFFRKVTDEATGGIKYETVEASHRTNDYSGRSWLASELRRKSFKDLHTLWYVLARERNLLATQHQEGLRHELKVDLFTSVNTRVRRCKKSMARIKQVLNERRLAYEQAVKLHQGGVTPEQLVVAEPQPEEKGLKMFEEEAAPVVQEGSIPASSKPATQ